MALLDTFKEQVLSLGRSEARAKARPLLLEDESFERSAAGLDRRTSEGFVLFWLLSDRAVFLVAGGSHRDWAFRVPFECIAEVAFDFDDTAETLPWYVRIALNQSGAGAITTLDDASDPDNPLGAPSSRIVDRDERGRLARGEIIPLVGFGVLTRKFRRAVAIQMAESGGTFHIHGEDRAEAQRKLRARKRSKGEG